MADSAHNTAERELEAFKSDVQATFKQAQDEAQKTLDEFLEQFREEDEKRRAQVNAGELSKKEWMEWRKSKLLQGERLKNTLERVAQAYTNANKIAVEALNGRLPKVYAENANFGAWQACEASGLDLSFDLLDADTVQHMLVNGEELFTQPKVDISKSQAWSKKLMSSQLTQGVMLGESIPKLAKRLQNVTNSNYKIATRTARTAVTGAQNAGRVNSYKRAQNMGIKLKQEWLATLDLRTRHSHRRLDGERVEVGEKFSNGCRYPGDPEAPYSEVMNCRCTLIAAVDGVEDDAGRRWSRLPEGMTYEQWKGAQQAFSSIQAKLNTGEKVTANIMRKTLALFVPLGAEKSKTAADYLDLCGVKARHVKVFDEAVQYVPTKMLKTLKRANVAAVRDYSFERSEYNPTTNTITIGKNGEALTVVHEIMHAVEEHDRRFLRAEKTYFQQRTAGKEVETVEKLTGDYRYSPNEYAYNVGKKCINPYAFKIYPNQEGYELMSLGVETLYRSPSAYVKDFGMLKWVLFMMKRFS